MGEKAITLTLSLKRDQRQLESRVSELTKLVQASGGEVLFEIIQHRDQIEASTFFGQGKLKEVANLMEQYQAETLVVNDELSGSQTRNIEKIIGHKVVDRTNLILDIFAQRAQGHEGVLQVKLAQLKYRLPRLVGFRDYLSREGGGIGTRGPGEQKLELDRRAIRKEIDRLKESLRKVERIRQTKRERRLRGNLPKISLLGYTNAGKSTLLNALAGRYPTRGSPVHVQDMLFATLDPSHRLARFSHGASYILSDTVGFVKDLPTELVEAFSSTLEEVQYADLILHVIDASDPYMEEEIETTHQILKRLRALNKPVLRVYNKKDRLKEPFYPPPSTEESILISAHEVSDIDRLIKKMEDLIRDRMKKVDLFFDYQHQDQLAEVMSRYHPLALVYEPEGVKISLWMYREDAARFRPYEVNGP